MYSDAVHALADQATTKLAEQRRSLAGHLVRSALAGMYVGAAIVLIFTIGGLLSLHAPGAVRLLMGVCFGGALTIVALAHEADVPRNALTQRHLDLKNEFYEHIKEKGAPSDVEVRLRAQIATLKQTIANKNQELAQLRQDVPALVRAVHQLTLENQELREQLALPQPTILPLHPRKAD